jgi:threonylcarbamoyladenosine tRNA methylthiotransferase MtaB
LEVSYLHVFPYSERNQTKAILLPGKIPQKIKDERSKSLIELSEQKRKTFYNKQVGRIEKVLFESAHENKWIGYTSNYIKTETEHTEQLINQTITVKLAEVLPSGNMKGIIINE